MIAEGAAEIDLYDNIDEDFVEECSDLNELYDDVGPLNSETSGQTTGFTKPFVSTRSYADTLPPARTQLTSNSGRRVSGYIGNLTWWTTDQDLQDAMHGIGVNDLLEIKFLENRQNGQSKGYCTIVLGSDQSLRVAIEKLPKIELHGQNPVVTHCTKQNLLIFEKAAGGDAQPLAKGREEKPGTVHSPSLSKAPPLMSTPTMPASLGFSLRNNTSLMGQAAPNIRQLGSLANSFQALASQNIPGLTVGSNLGLNVPVVTSVLMTPSVPPPPLPGNASNLLSHAFNFAALPTSGAATLPPNLMTQPMAISNTVAPTMPPSNLMNFNNSASQGVRQQFDNYGRPVIHTYTPSLSGKLSETEFEDILQRNKTVSSSAINRAVQDAASGDYASAIETLVTAISLIKQSKIASDDRCRILINSLQDTLHGIESKSYGAKSSSRRRHRSYSDSGSENEIDGYGSMGGSGSGNGRRHRERNDRSRSRERRDRHHRRSHDRTSSNYYSSQQSLPATVSGSSGLSSSGQGSSLGGSDRYRDSRYRH